MAGGGDSLGVELARRDLEGESSERYKGAVVRSRLERVLNEAVKSNTTAREEVRRFPDRYIASDKAPDGRLLRSDREIRDAFRAHFRDRFARCTDLPLREFRSYLDDFPSLGAAEAASCEGVVTECEVRDALKQVGLNKSPGTRWFTRRSVLEDVAHVCAYSDGYVQPLVRPGSHPWQRYQGRDHITEERRQACLGGFR